MELIKEMLNAHSNILENHKCEIDLLRNNINVLQLSIFELAKEIKELKKIF